ncbi:ribulose-1,5-bisphosphate carboxylase small subunit, partial [Clostridioides difficile]|nr:ribulose-1,5-bisphosphate carboxylase small subunit [Clostridioides difficile]
TAAVAATATPVKARMVAPFTGFKSNTIAFPIPRKAVTTRRSKNVGKVSCMKVWPPLGKKKFETLSYLPELTREQLLKEIDYLIRSKWIPCIEFELEHGFVYRKHHHSPGYYDGRYWTMWKLPMYGCTDAVQVANEVDLCVKEYPKAFVRIIGFDNRRQVQCISFIAAKPPGF